VRDEALGEERQDLVFAQIGEWLVHWQEQVAHDPPQSMRAVWLRPGCPFFMIPEETMPRVPVPSICIPCIQRLRAQCPHRHTSFWGGFHLTAGNFWDDIIEICDDCGANLDDLPVQQNEAPPEDEEIPF
jgi:hypothetical protein